jgi:cytochrome P450
MPMPKLTGLPRVTIRGPKPLPLAGAFVNVLRFFADPVGAMLDLQRRFGALSTVNDGDPGLVCAIGPSWNREVLSNAALFQNNEDFLFKAPEGSAFQRFNASLVLMNGERHKRARRLMMPAFQKAAIEGYARTVTSTADELCARWPLGQRVDVAQLVRELTLVVAMRCFFGVESVPDAEALGKIAVAQLDALASPRTILFPFDLPGTTYRALLVACEQLEARFRALVADKRRAREPSADVLSMLVRARDESGSAFSDDELMGHMNTLFVAGHETTANTLAWTLFLLVQHPEVLGALLDEGASVLRGGLPAPEHIPRMPLLDRVVKESMRLLPATPMLFMRVCSEATTLGDHPLPAKANVVLSPLLTHRDPTIYPEPKRFVPARWETLEPSIHDYLPFGAGPRMCLGAAFAQQALRLLLPMLLQRFRFTLASDAEISRVVRGITLGPKHGLPMRLDRPGAGALPAKTSGGGAVRGDIHALVELG